MKVLRISLLLLMVFSLTTGICYGQTAKDYYDKGIEHGVAGEFEKAQREFKKALEIDPFLKPAKNCLGLIGDALNQRIEMQTALYLFKGVAYGNKGMFDKAIAQLNQAIQINPEYALAHNNLGIAFHEKGMFDEAIAAYKRAIEIDPEFGEAHHDLGQVYHFKEMFDEAIAAYKRAIEIDPEYALAHNNLGLAYFDKKMYDEAIAACKKAIEIDSEFAEPHYGLAMVYYFKAEYSLAVKHCDRAIALGCKVYPGFLEALEPYRKK